MMVDSQVFDLNTIIAVLVLIGVIILFLIAAGFVAYKLLKWRKREGSSIDSVLLQVAVPRGNEIQIDAMEQVFASIYSIKKGGWKGIWNLTKTLPILHPD